MAGLGAAARGLHSYPLKGVAASAASSARQAARCLCPSLSLACADQPPALPCRSVGPVCVQLCELHPVGGRGRGSRHNAAPHHRSAARRLRGGCWAIAGSMAGRLRASLRQAAAGRRRVACTLRRAGALQEGALQEGALQEGAHQMLALPTTWACRRVPVPPASVGPAARPDSERV